MVQANTFSCKVVKREHYHDPGEPVHGHVNRQQSEQYGPDRGRECRRHSDGGAEFKDGTVGRDNRTLSEPLKVALRTSILEVTRAYESRTVALQSSEAQIGEVTRGKALTGALQNLQMATQIRTKGGGDIPVLRW